jgi:hypothetical protein
MHKYSPLVVCLLASFAFAGNPNVTAPINNSTVQSPVHFAATAGSTTCSQGVASMGIYVTTGNKTFVENGTTLDTNLTLADGTYTSTIEQWDKCGGASKTHVTYSVSGGGGSGSGTTLSNIQASGGWSGFGELPPDYAICSSCGSGITWSMKQGITSPSLSGKAAKYTIGGTKPYADVLWNNHLIGPFSSQGLPDPGNKLIATLSKFTYDIYFYGDDLSLSENIEFDLGQFFNDHGYLFGLQCQIVNGKVWGLWNPNANHWEDTTIPCNPPSKTWNHAIFEFERTSTNELLYKTVTLNGVTTNINVTYPRYSTPGWDGLVVNFQLDGNYKQAPYSVYVDKLNVTYQ